MRSRGVHLRRAAVALLPIATVAGLATGCGPVLTLKVNSFADANDAVPGDGVCEVTPGAGDCTLRAAVDEANATAGLVEIDIPGGTYALTLPGVEDAHAGGDLDVHGDMWFRSIGGASYTISGTGIDRVIDVWGKLDMDNATVTGGVTAMMGGGVRSNPGSTLKMTRTRVIKNRSSLFGGGVATIDTSADIETSELSGNSTDAGGGLGDVGSGPTTLVNTTVSNNATLVGAGAAGPFPPGVGAGIATDAPLSLTYVTIRANTTAFAGAGGGIWNMVPATATASSVSGHGAGLDCAGGPVATAGFNEDSDGTCLGGVALPTDMVAVPPLLGPLAFNGGPTETHLPGAGSPLVNTIPAGAPGICDGTINIDQRLFPRPSATAPACDRGAVEVP
jgi:CSLREA domain-containing protein